MATAKDIADDRDDLFNRDWHEERDNWDDGLCGDCMDGHCHWGSSGPTRGQKCPCERHAVSVRARETDD
jgi:hypothetical protein